MALLNRQNYLAQLGAESCTICYDVVCRRPLFETEEQIHERINRDLGFDESEDEEEDLEDDDLTDEERLLAMEQLYGSRTLDGAIRTLVAVRITEEEARRLIEDSMGRSFVERLERGFEDEQEDEEEEHEPPMLGDWIDVPAEIDGESEESDFDEQTNVNQREGSVEAVDDERPAQEQAEQYQARQTHRQFKETVRALWADQYEYRHLRRRITYANGDVYEEEYDDSGPEAEIPDQSEQGLVQLERGVVEFRRGDHEQDPVRSEAERRHQRLLDLGFNGEEGEYPEDEEMAPDSDEEMAVDLDEEIENAAEAEGDLDAYGWYTGGDGRWHRVALDFDVDEDEDQEMESDAIDVTGGSFEEEGTANDALAAEKDDKDTVMSDGGMSASGEGEVDLDETTKIEAAGKRRSERIAAFSSSPTYTGTRIRTGLKSSR